MTNDGVTSRSQVLQTVLWGMLLAGWVGYGIGVAPSGPAWVVSALLTALSAGRVTAAWARDGQEAYWIFIALVGLQLGTLATLSSLLNRLEPTLWLLLQGVIALGTILRWPSGVRLKGARPGRLQVSHFRRGLLVGPLVLGLLVWVGWLGHLAYVTPLYNYDDRNYHASRVLYWIQYRSIFHFATSNVRQTAFPLGSETYFLWAILLTRDERVGRMVAWAGFPMALGGLYGLLRTLNVRREAALLGTALWAVTPIVAAHVTTLKPDIYFTLFLEGTTFWFIRAWQTKEASELKRRLGWSGLFCALAINTRWSGLFALMALALAPVLASGRFPIHRWRAYGSLALGLGLGTGLSGLSVTLVENLAHFHHPLGPAPMRWVHQGDWSLRRLYLHTVRFPFLLLEVPSWPEDRWRGIAEKAIGQAVVGLGADAPLPLEDEWAGRFVFRLPRYGEKFSAGGLLWGLALMLGTIHLTRRVITRNVDIVALMVLTELSLTWGTVWTVRWMVHGGVPERLLIGPYALGLGLYAYFFLHRRSPFGRVPLVPALLTTSMLAWMLWGTLHTRAIVTPDRVPRLAALRWEPFQGVRQYVPPGSRILLVAHENTRDYALFDPIHRYSNVVIQWGLRPFDAARLEAEICRYRIRYVIIHDDGMTAPPGLIPGVPQAIEAYLRERLGSHRIPLEWEGVRLYHLHREDCSPSGPP